jgi:hypothetical protein
MAERKGHNLTLILLDWEKAFDKIDQGRMMQAIKRLGVPEHITAIIENIYREPKYAVKTTQGESREQN